MFKSPNLSPQVASLPLPIHKRRRATDSLHSFHFPALTTHLWSITFLPLPTKTFRATSNLSFPLDRKGVSFTNVIICYWTLSNNYAKKKHYHLHFRNNFDLFMVIIWKQPFISALVCNSAPCRLWELRHLILLSIFVFNVGFHSSTAKDTNCCRRILYSHSEMNKNKFHTHSIIFSAGTLYSLDDIDFHFWFIERKTFKLLPPHL